MKINNKEGRNVVLVLVVLLSINVVVVSRVSAVTQVDQYYRSDPDSSPYNNYSFPGNSNPYTGEIAPGNPETYLYNYYNRQSGGQNGESLLRYLNPPSPSRVYIRALEKSESDRLLEEQQKFFENLKKETDQRIEQIKNTSIPSAVVVTGCVPALVSGCTTENDYGNQRAMWARSGYPDTMKANLDECRRQIDEYNAAKAKYDQCMVDWQNQKINQIADRAVEIERLKRESEYYQAQLEQAKQEYSETHNLIQGLIQGQTSCTNQHGSYSTYNPKINTCECKEGYAPDSKSPFSCIPIELYCKVEAGWGAANRRSEYVDAASLDTNCICKDGYEWNGDKTQCLQTAQKPSEKSEVSKGKFDDIFKPQHLVQETKSALHTLATSLPASTTTTTLDIATSSENSEITVAPQPTKNQSRGFVNHIFHSIASFFLRLKFW